MRTVSSSESATQNCRHSRRAGAAAGCKVSAPALVVLAVMAFGFVPRAASAQEDAEEAEASRWSFGAFGTLGLVYSTEDQADFLISPARPDGPGHSETVTADTDSVLGGQVTFQATPKLTAVLQLVAEQNADDNYAPEVEWANLRYEVTPDLSVRVGRVALPGFLVSDFRKVSYANPWIRPPVELYRLVPVSSVDGGEVTWRRHAGDWTSTFNVNYGRAESDFPGNAGSVVADDAWNVSATFERGGWTLRAAGATLNLDIDAFDPLFDGFRAFGPEGEAIADRFAVDEAPLHFVTAGGEYGPGRWFAIGEVAWTESNSVLGDVLAGYLTAGYRSGAITSHATYSRSEALSDTSHPGLSLVGLPPPLVPVAAGLNAGLNGILGSLVVQQTLAVGGRWDFRTGMALKLQLDWIDLLEDSPGTFGNPQPGFERGGSAQLVSLAYVFVF